MTNVNYTIHNYCRKCNLKYLKIVKRCSICGSMLRTKRRRLIKDYLERRRIKDKNALQT